MPKAGFEDAAEFFSAIFGGDAFVDLIGELSLMKDLTHTMDVTMEQMEEEQLAANAEEKLNIQRRSRLLHHTYHRAQKKGLQVRARLEEILASRL